MTKPLTPMKHYFGFSKVAAAESHLQVMERWLTYYQNRRKEDGSRDVDGIVQAEARVERAKADVELQHELRRLEQSEKTARNGWYGTETGENQARYSQAVQNIENRKVVCRDQAAAEPATERTELSYGCLGDGDAVTKEGPGTRPGLWEALGNLRKYLLGREDVRQRRAEPQGWDRPCCEYIDGEADERGR